MNKKLNALSASLNKALQPPATNKSERQDAMAKLLMGVEPLPKVAEKLGESPTLISDRQIDQSDPVDLETALANIASEANYQASRAQIANEAIITTEVKTTTEANIATLAEFANEEIIATEAITTKARIANEADPAKVLFANVAIPAKARVAAVINVANVAGELRIPNRIMDGLLPLLTPAETVIYLRLYRLSHGYHKDNCLVGLDKLAASTNISRRTVQTVIEALERKGLIERLGANLGGQMKGNIYQVYLPGTLADPATEANIANVAIPATIKDPKKKINKYKLKQLIDHYRQINTGRSEYRIADLAADVKSACAREGLEFDSSLFNALLG